MQKLGDVLKNRVFDTSNAAQDAFAEEQRRKAKVFSQNDLDAAVAKAEVAGIKKGFEQATEDTLNTVLRTISQATAHLDHNFSSLSQEIQSSIIMMIASMMEKSFPVLIQQKGLSELTGFIQSIIKEGLESQTLKIYVHPDVIQTIDQHIKSIPAENAVLQRCQVIPDPALKPSACRVEWDKGSFGKDLEKQCEHILKLLADN